MKIVNIEDYFHPDNGYQINILAKFFSRFGHDVTIITSKMDKMPDFLTSFFGKEDIEERDRAFEQEYGVKIIRLPILKYVSGRSIYKPGLLKLIRSLSPDVLFVHDNYTAAGMWATWKVKKLGCALFMDNHMCEMASRNRFHKLLQKFYKTFLTPKVIKNQLTIVATGEDRFAENLLGVPRELSPLIAFGSDTMLFHPDAEQRSAFRKEHGISDDAFVVLYAGKLDEYKGGKFLADLTCQPLHTDKEVVYVVVGNTVGEYGKEVESRFTESHYRLLRFPTQKYPDLPKFFQMADLALLPKQCSLSLFDMNACGLPVLGEDNEVNVERCGYGKGWVFRQGDLNDFAEKLAQIVNLDEAELKAVSETALNSVLENYNYEDKAREFEKEIEKAVERATYVKKK